MLIINADDYGLNCEATDRILECYRLARITSASAMVFMEDSERAAQLSRSVKCPMGLHLNLTDAFTGLVPPSAVSSLQRVSSFLRMSRYHFVLYNPSIRNDLERLFQMQYEEFVRLYGMEPVHIDGHRHAHLCTNMLVGRVIPESMKVRRSFSFRRGEKSILNIAYRRVVDFCIERIYRCTDKFFSIDPITDVSRIRRIFVLASSCDVELMVHPEKTPHYRYLTGVEYLNLISSANRLLCPPPGGEPQFETDRAISLY